jgi:hypothetical protein
MALKNFAGLDEDPVEHCIGLFGLLQRRGDGNTILFDRTKVIDDATVSRLYEASSVTSLNWVEKCYASKAV